MARKADIGTLNRPQTPTESVMAFMSEETPAPTEKKAAAGTRKPRKADEAKERKTQRIDLLIEPSLYARAAAAANKQGRSLGNYVRRAIEQALEKEE